MGAGVRAGLQGKHEDRLKRVRCYWGLGDNLYMRPFVNRMAERDRDMWVETPWPEMYWNQPTFRFIQPSPPLRTQRFNIENQPAGTWSTAPGIHRADPLRLSYHDSPRGVRRGGNVIEGLASMTGIESIEFHLPASLVWRRRAHDLRLPVDSGKRLCLVRPPTIRKEWSCPSRNPAPEIIPRLMDEFRDAFHFVGVGWLQAGEEEIDGGGYRFDSEFLHGELHWTTIHALMQEFNVAVLATPSFMLPMVCAAGAEAFIVFGGHMSPRQLFDPRMGLERVEHYAPHPPCECQNKNHECNKDWSWADVRHRFSGHFGL